MTVLRRSDSSHSFSPAPSGTWSTPCSGPGEASGRCMWLGTEAQSLRIVEHRRHDACGMTDTEVVQLDLLSEPFATAFEQRKRDRTLQCRAPVARGDPTTGSHWRPRGAGGQTLRTGRYRAPGIQAF